MSNTEKLASVPLSRLVVDYDWNSRTGVAKLVLAKSGEERPAGETGEGGENEFSGLATSIEEVGQKDPVHVTTIHPVTGKPMPGDKLFLTSGFRRYRAIECLAQKNSVKAPEIKVLIADLSPFQSRLDNLIENVARRNLEPADRCSRLLELKALMVAEKGEYTHESLAKLIGVNRTYVTRMFSIEEKTTKKVLQKWHGSQAQVPFETMEKIAKMKEEKQEAAYNEAVKAKTDRANGSSNGSTQDVDRACKRAEKVGTLLGTVCRLEMFGPVSERINWKANIMELIEVNVRGEQGPTEKQLTKISDAAKDAYKAALEYEEPSEDEDEDEDEDDDSDEATA